MAQVIKDSTEFIDELECIGESLSKINTNFFKLDDGLFKTSTTLVNLSAKVDNLDARTTNNPGGIQLTFNRHNYSIQGIVRDGAINTVKLGGDIGQPGKTLIVNPILNNLTNVNTSDVQLGNVLKWNGSNWTNEPDVGKVKLAELDDTYIPTTPTNGFVLRWDSNQKTTLSPNGQWVASRDFGKEKLRDMDDVSINTTQLPNQNQFYLRYNSTTQRWAPDRGPQAGLGLSLTTSNSTFSHLAHTGKIFSTAANPLGLQIAENAIGSFELAGDSTNNVLRAVDHVHIKDNAVRTRHILVDNVTDVELRKAASDGQDNLRAVTSNHIRLNAVTTSKIENDAITTSKILDNAVNYDKLSKHPTLGTLSDPPSIDSQRAVDHVHIRNNAVRSRNILVDNVTSRELAKHVTEDSERAVTRNHIVNEAVSLEKCDFNPILKLEAGPEIVLDNEIREGGVVEPTNGAIKVGVVPTVQWFDAAVLNVDPIPQAVNFKLNRKGKRKGFIQVEGDATNSWDNVDVVTTGDGTSMNAIRLFRNDLDPPRITFNTVAPVSRPVNMKIYWYTAGAGGTYIQPFDFNKSPTTQLFNKRNKPKGTKLEISPVTPGPLPKKGSFLRCALWRNEQLFYGGNFTKVGNVQNIRRFARIVGVNSPNAAGSPSNFTTNPRLTNGQVFAIENVSVGVADYIAVGGTFNTNQGRRLVILNNGTSTTQQWYTFNGPVYALHARGNFLYVGGKFTKAKRGNSPAVPFQPADTLCRINMTTLEIDTAWTSKVWSYFRNPGVGRIFAIKSTPSRIFVGGSFNLYRTVRTLSHGNLAAFDINTGELVEFSNNIRFRFNAEIRTLAIENPENPTTARLYAGGSFTRTLVNNVDTVLGGPLETISGVQQRRYLKKAYQHLIAFSNINENIDIIQSWNPRPNKPVYAIDVDYFNPTGHVYVGGKFDRIRDATRTVLCSHVAAITRAGVGNEQVIEANNWGPKLDGPVFSIQYVNSLGGTGTVIVAGNFNQATGSKIPITNYFDIAMFPRFPVNINQTSNKRLKFVVGCTHAGEGGNLTFEEGETTSVVADVLPAGNLNITDIPYVPGSLGIERGNLCRFLIERVPAPEFGNEFLDSNGSVDIIGVSLDWDVPPESIPLLEPAPVTGVPADDYNPAAGDDEGETIDTDI